MAQLKFILWLAYWYLQNDLFEFQWDGGNVAKNLIKHGVTTGEAESVFSLRLAVPIGRQISPPVDEERLCILGPSELGRMLSIVFTLREGHIRPISARMASRKERRFYEEIRKKTEGL